MSVAACRTMRPRLPRSLTCIKFDPERRARGTDPYNMAGKDPRGEAGYLLMIFSPVLALGVFAAMLALLAGLSGWYAHEMFLTAGGLGLTVAMLLSFLLYRQRDERRASALALQNVEARVGGIVESAMDAIVA